MSEARYYIEVRATAKTTIDKDVGLLMQIHPDMWEDKPLLHDMFLHELTRVAAQRKAAVYADTLEIVELRRLPMFEHQRRRVIDGPQDSQT